jgi:Lar family restriction alleviation protein
MFYMLKRGSIRFAPCPFCGSESLQDIKLGDGSRDYWTVLCGSCFAEGPAVKTRLLAVRYWNKRTAQPQPPAAADFRGLTYIKNMKEPYQLRIIVSPERVACRHFDTEAEAIQEAISFNVKEGFTTMVVDLRTMDGVFHSEIDSESDF